MIENKFQDQEQLDQDLEYWLTPRESQSTHIFFSEEEKRVSTWLESLYPEVSKTRNSYLEGYVSMWTMVIFKWLEVAEEPGDKVDAPPY